MKARRITDISANSIASAQTSSGQASKRLRGHSRRAFLKAAGVGLAALGAAAATGGCIIMPAFLETANLAVKEKFQIVLADNGYKRLSGLSAPELEGYVDFIAKNSRRFGPTEQFQANSLIREWIALSDFMTPCHSLNCFSNKSDLEANVKLLVTAKGGNGSGTLFTSEGHILTAAHTMDAVGTSPFSKVTIARGLDMAIAKVDTISQSSSPRALVKLAYTKPCSGAAVVIYGYPAGSSGILQEVKGVVTLHDNAFGVMLLVPIAQALAGGGPGDFKFYGERSANLHGASGGPVALEDGRIVGVISKGAVKGEGSDTNVDLAMDTDAIREAVIRYMEEHLAGPIQELAARINSRLG